jgi:chaperonin GroES
MNQDQMVGQSQQVDGQLQEAYQSPQQYNNAPMGTPMPNSGMFSPGSMNEAEGGEEEMVEDDTSEINKLLAETNIAENLDEDQLTTIGADAYEGFMSDLESRREWEDNVDEWTRLAIQVKEEKTYPWPKASNVKYPLLSTAAMQFAARAYPSLIPSDGKIVKAQVIGKDPTGQKQARAERTSIYASYQLMHEMDCWEEDMDKLLIMLPIVGTMFKKTYWDSLTEKNCSKLVMPKNLVVNYWTSSLHHCERVSEIIEMSPRLVKERQNAGIFRDVDLGFAPTPDATGPIPQNDRTTPYTVVEQHTFLDLDEDGYEEPYVVTFHKESRQVLRIVARFDTEAITTDEKGGVVRIEPTQYYTKFGFIPNPDGSFYDIGFGVLLGPINESVNTLINQLIDSGTINNLQSGFIGKGLRIRMGEQRFQPGEWKAVNATGDDLKKQILPLPTKEPSKVLFELMGALITSGKELASVAEIFTGKMPGQNTPATTTMATVEQGMKVFTAVYKRTYRSLQEEFKKLYKLNATYLNPQTYVEVMDTTVDPADFKPEGYDICPGADPSAVSQNEKLMKAQGLIEMLPMGVLDPIKVITRVLEAQEQPNYQELFSQAVQQTGAPPPPPPDPKQIEMQMKSQMEQQKAQLKQQELGFKSQMQQRDAQFKQAMEAQKQAQDLKYKEMEMKLSAAEALHKQRIFEASERQKMAQKQQAHQQKLVHNEQAAKQKQEMAKSQPAKTSKAGNGNQ